MELSSSTFRTNAVIAAAALTAAIAWVDWQVEPNISLGILYLFPILLASPFLRRWPIVLAAAVCSVLREQFAEFAWEPGAPARLVMTFVGFTGSGLFARELWANRRKAVEQAAALEKQMSLRLAAEELLRSLVESTPAAILTIDGGGRVLLANEAAHRLLGFADTPLKGEAITPYIPALAGFLGDKDGDPGFRTAIEAPGRRRGGEEFLAHIWVSCCETGSGKRVSAIIFDASDRLRHDEEGGLNRVLAASRILVKAVSHEVRNLSAAINVVHRNLRSTAGGAAGEDLEALGTLTEALRRIAAADLAEDAGETEEADISKVLRELRIILEPQLRDAGVAAAWTIPETALAVCGGRHELLQVFLNLARNSLRALKSVPAPEFGLRVSGEDGRIVVRFHNNGPPMADPEHLFQPFQEGASGTGLGLFISRSLLKSFGGNLRYEAAGGGCCFAVELRTAAPTMEALA